MADREIYCPACKRQTLHIKARASTIMCTVCRTQRPWNTTGWQTVSWTADACLCHRAGFARQ